MSSWKKVDIEMSSLDIKRRFLPFRQKFVVKIWTIK